VDVVVSGGGDVSPVPTPTPGPTPQPEPLPTPVPTPLPDATWKYFYFEDVFTNYPDFSAMSPVSTGATSSFGMSEKGARTDNFAFVYEGESWVNGNPDVSGGQPFTFYLKCDEGCRLYINDFLAVDNYPSRGLEKSGSMKLSHRSIMSVRVEYFDKTGAENLEVNWAGPNFEKRPLTSDFLPF
jgi:hypothetical protein